MTKQFLLLALVTAFFSCSQKKSPATMPLDADYQKAESYLDHRNDSAFYYFNKVATNAKTGLQRAMAYNRMGLIQEEAGDYFGSQESMSLSLRCLDTANGKGRKCLASDYNELGLNSISLKNYDEAIVFFDQAIHFSPNKEYEQIYQNNKALALEQKGDYLPALKIFQTALAQTTEPENYARVLTNLATTKRLYRPGYNAAPELLKALGIRWRHKDNWGLNSSYGRLADFYTSVRSDSAQWYAGKMYQIARQLNSPDDQLEALQKLIKFSPPTISKSYFALYTALNDSLQATRNTAKNQFAFIRYDAEKNRADNLRLQTDNSEKKFQLTALLLLLVTGFLVALFWYRKIRWDAKEKLLVLSQKVHDVVANGIYRVMNEVEHRETLDKNQLLDQLEIMYERSRDITYENEKVIPTDFAGEIQALLNSFKSGSLKLAVDGNENRLWKEVNDEVKRALKPILQELMVNMAKHSHATHALVAFEIREGDLLVNYRDNGIGLPKRLSTGNGLRNTENRIAALSGRVKFVTDIDDGAAIHIALPLT